MIEKAVTDRTTDLQAREQELLNQNLLFNTALTNMSQGLVMFDAQGRVIICNQRYLDMYGHTHVQPGCTLAELLRQRVATGSFAGDPVAYAQAIVARAAAGEGERRIIEISGGRTIASSKQPMATGGWGASNEESPTRRAA